MNSTKRPARAWPTAASPVTSWMWATYRRVSSPSVQVSVSHGASPGGWSGDPGIEFWDASLLISFSGGRMSELPAGVVASAFLVRVAPDQCDGISYALSNLSADLSVIGQAIDADLDAATFDEPGVGYSDFVVAVDVVVDKYWRGGGLGPALLSVAAGLLRAEPVFLSPYALATRVSADGVCYSDYYIPRPGPQAQKKVEAAWRKAGFRELSDQVVWTRNTPDKIADAQDRIVLMQDEAGTRHARAWYRRRGERRHAADTRANV